MKPVSHSLLNCFRALILVAVTATPLAAQLATQTYNGHDVVADEVLIKFRQVATDDLQAKAKIDASIQQSEMTADIDAAQTVGSTGWQRWHSRSNDVSTLMGLLTNAQDVVGVEPNWIAHITTNDAYFPCQWALQNTGQSCPPYFAAGTAGVDIGAVAAWSISTGSTSVVVGVEDTGIDYNHPDLSANVWSAPYQFSFLQGSTLYTCPAGTHGWNTFNNTCDPLDDNDHGSHVSGTIGAATNNSLGVAGVNWNTKIITAKMCNASGNCPASNQINAIQFMEGAKFYFGGTTGSANIRVLSNSWGQAGGFSQSLLDEINKANTADMLFVAAAGNAGTNNDITPFYPASYNAPNVVAVAAFDNLDNLAGFSNYGASSVHLGGPGVAIVSTIRVADGSYAYFDGTSMATPHVSGTAALSLAECQGDTEFLKPNLLQNVVVTPALTGKTVTGGRANAYNSLHAGSLACPGTGDGLVTGNELSRVVYQNGHYVTIYDSGTISLTVNGATKTLTYGQYSTAYVLTGALRDQINNDGSYPVRAHMSRMSQFPSWGDVSLAAKTTGGSTCYSLSTSSTWNTQYFPQPSFRISPSGAALVGCW